jgi:HAMP domain-containing protein
MSLLRFYSFKLRNTIGREAFTITGALSGGNPWNAHKQTELARLSRRIDFLWLTIPNYVSDPDLNPADIKKAADEFCREYFRSYRKTRDAVISMLSAGSRPMTAAQYMDAVTPAQDAAENIMYIASNKTRDYSQQVAEKAEGMLHFAIWQTAIILMLLALSIAIISRRVILPLKKIMVALGKLRKEDYNLEIPYTRYRDEFGSLSRSFSGFRKSLIEKKQAEQEREKLIIELKDAIANIKTLSGLLPICAGCKKIRNDQGYWQQLESYLADHSEADFSHGICPECAKKLYPDYYKKASEDKK